MANRLAALDKSGMDAKRLKPWDGRSGRLLSRFNRDWVTVRRWLDARERAGKPAPSAAAPAGRSPPHGVTPAPWFPPPARIAMTSDR